MGGIGKTDNYVERLRIVLLRHAWLILIIGLSDCKTDKPQDEAIQEESTLETDSVIQDDDFVIADETTWSLQPVYGHYENESNSTGFFAQLDLEPEGNDLAFSLSVRQSGCDGKANGTIGMIVFSENEYAGFFDNDDCRLEFIFNLKENSVRIQEVGFCRLRASGCNFAGTYRKRQPQ